MAVPKLLDLSPPHQDGFCWRCFGCYGELPLQSRQLQLWGLVLFQSSPKNSIQRIDTATAQNVGTHATGDAQLTYSNSFPSHPSFCSVLIHRLSWRFWCQPIPTSCQKRWKSTCPFWFVKLALCPSSTVVRLACLPEQVWLRRQAMGGQTHDLMLWPALVRSSRTMTSSCDSGHDSCVRWSRFTFRHCSGVVLTPLEIQSIKCMERDANSIFFGRRLLYPHIAVCL